MSMMLRRRELMTCRLPLMYQEVEYLRVNGTAAINCEIPLDFSTDSIDITSYVFSVPSWAWVFATCNISNYEKYCGIQLAYTTKDMRLFNGTGTNPISYNGSPIQTPYTVRFDKNGVYINGARQAANNRITYDRFVLFGWYEAEAEGRAVNCQISKIKINDYELIPCYRKTDNVPGFYDQKRNKLWTKSAGWGNDDIIVGPNVY